MIIDLAQDVGTQARQVQADVCVVGAGPAGISLALTLARSRPDWQVVLLEAGGTDNASERGKAIYRVSQSGRDYAVLDISRRRKLGGTTAHWGGWSKPLDLTDYEENPRWDQPGWPLLPADLEAFYRQACDWCELGGDHFSVDTVTAHNPDSMLDLSSVESIENRLFRFSPPTRFGERYAEDLESQSNLSCYLHANLQSIFRQGDRVEALQAVAFEGASLRVEANQFVFAMGGMETTRYLLNMREEQAADGEGIYSPHLGRYFADHFGLSPARLLAPAELRYHLFADGEVKVMPVLTFSDAVLRNEGQNNTCARLYASAADSFIGTAYPSIGAYGFNPGQYWQYEVKLTVEPRPNPASRLSLTNDRCELGLRRLDLDWQLDRGDFVSAYQLLERMAVEFGSAGLGRLQITQPLEEAVASTVNGGCHHMGTARMAADPADGVVDPNLRVHNLANLYVASSAAFPRYGYSNPTLTIVALALRLADHLSTEAPA